MPRPGTPDGFDDLVDDADLDETDVDLEDDLPDADEPEEPAAESVARNPRKTAAPALNLNVSMPKVEVRHWLTTARDGMRNLSGRPLTSFHLIVSLSVILTAVGLIMVLSASSVEGYAQHTSSYGAFFTQVLFAIMGWFAFFCVLKIPFRYLRSFSWLGIIVAIALLALVLVPGIGVEIDGARRWFDVMGVSIQPSDLAKMALCIWGAHILAARRVHSTWGRELLFPLVPVAALMAVLIILEPNLSTTVILAIIVAALLWFSGLPGIVFAGFTGAAVVLGVVAALTAEHRAARVFSFLGGSTDDPLGAGYQALQAKYALANGGIFGVGLGQSTAKWSYLPNAHNDFIFAIIGEELGLVGGMIVVGLFLLLAYAGMRIARRSVDPFLRLLSATITVLITAQVFINVGYVVGLLPVTGIQLPLLSQGGTSMLTMLTMLGLLASAARHEPAAVVALAGTRPKGLARLLKLPPPAPYRPQAVDIARDRLERRRAGARPAKGRTAQRPAPSPRRAPAPRRAPDLRSDEIHYAARQASTRHQSGQRRSATRGRATGSPRRTEYRHR